MRDKPDPGRVRTLLYLWLNVLDGVASEEDGLQLLQVGELSLAHVTQPVCTPINSSSSILTLVKFFLYTRVETRLKNVLDNRAQICRVCALKIKMRRLYSGCEFFSV